MKKKLLCLLSAMILVCSLAACGNSDSGSDDSSNSGKSDFDTFLEVQANMQDIKDMEFKMEMDMKSTTDGEANEDISLNMSGTGKEILTDPKNPEMEMNYKMTLPGLGSDVESTMYMKDNTVYMDLMGQKVKVDASNEMAAAANLDTSDLLAITEDMVSNLDVSENGSDTVYSFDLDAQKAIDYFQKNAGASQQMGTLDADSLTFKKMNVVVTVGEDQMVKNIDMDCVMTTKVEDTSMDMTYTISMEYISINSDLKIDFPDFKDYQELTV